MSDFLIEDDREGANAPEIGVSELSGRIKRAMEDAFGHIRVKGEIGRISRPRSGHIYLDLKDDKAVLGGVIWRGAAQKLRVQPEEGMEVIAEGRITTFPGASKYQMVIERISPAGVGALMAMLEARKKALAAEGLFAPERKKKPPFLPEVIGVVTSPSGAVIRDILHRLADRMPRRVLVWPVAVQGEACAGEVSAAIRGFNVLTPDGPVPRPDVLIIARGGGSMEDLWGFNEEVVARAAAESHIPLISAVGHETDTTLIDFVSDMRAPTPTAAAEMATPVRAELLADLAAYKDRLRRALGRALDERRARLRDLGRALPRVDALTAMQRQRLDVAAERLPQALRSVAHAQRSRLARSAGGLTPALLRRRTRESAERLAVFSGRSAPALNRAAQLARERFTSLRAEERMRRTAQHDLQNRAESVEKLGRLLRGFSYKATLERGYAAIRGAEGEVLSKAGQLNTGAHVEIEFADGRRRAVVDGAAPKRGRKDKDDADGGSDPQGELF